MKVLLINGSPHEKGSTNAALEVMKAEFEKEGVEAQIIHIGNQTIRGCTACMSCVKLGKCAFEDCVNEIAALFKNSDGIVFGSPVYYASANGTLISFLDRLFYSTKFTEGFDKRFKVGASVVAARRGGLTTTFDMLNKYFTFDQMPIVSSMYWNQVHGSNAEQVLTDEEGVQTMRVLARNMTFLMKSIALGREKFGLPEAEEKIKTDFYKN